MPFYKNCHASISILKISPRLKQSVTLSGLNAYYHYCWKPMMAPHFPPSFFFFIVVCQRQHQRSRGLLGTAASWEHISECYCSWSFSLSSLWSSLLSLHQPLHVALLPFTDPFQDGEERFGTHINMPRCFDFNHCPTQFFFKGGKSSTHKRDCF